VLNRKPKGTLIIIGGHEEKEGDEVILKEVSKRAQKGSKRLTIVTVATQLPEEVAAESSSVFKDLGVAKVEVVDVRNRDEAFDEARVEKIIGAAVIFFTGGDQLRISSQIGDSPVYRCLRDAYLDGRTIVGTSAGAAVMPETMLVYGPSDESHQIASLGMAPGLGLLPDVVIDTHFAERGRMGRLLGAVAQSPRILGLGIDEDTAIVVERGETFQVLGSGAVYVVDGSEISYSSLSDKNPEGIVCMYDVKLHVMGAGEKYDLAHRRPLPSKAVITGEP
jgi:cyanophycinase